MPFDASDFVPEKPSLAALEYALRHPESWPEGFKWNYELCSRCAMGLAIRGLGLPEPEDRETEIGWYGHFAEMFGMPTSEAQLIFYNLHRVIGHISVTPHHVADAIDAYLATHPPISPQGRCAHGAAPVQDCVSSSNSPVAVGRQNACGDRAFCEAA